MDYEVYGIILMPIIVGLLEVVKQLNINKKFIPLISVITSIILSIIFSPDGDYRKSLLIGLQLGLSSVGLYSSGKCIMENKSQGKK